MKSALGKTIGGISSFTRGTYNVLTFSRFRRHPSSVHTDSEGVGDRELNSLNGDARGGGDTVRPRVDQSPNASYTPPPQPASVPQEDDILYRKNNVYLKCKIGTTPTTPTGVDPAPAPMSPAVHSLRVLQEASLSPPQSLPASPSEDRVPGFLFIASRGSNYGSTLILNWAPNSSIIRCSGSIDSNVATASEVTHNELTTSSGSERDTHTPHKVPNSSSVFSLLSPALPFHSTPSATPTAMPTSRTEHKCVSLDLGEMEVIRVFYHTDDCGHKVSGEMVISSKQTDFWVFRFQNGGLTDLIHLLCSWKYFNHQEHKYIQCIMLHCV